MEPLHHSTSLIFTVLIFPILGFTLPPLPLSPVPDFFNTPPDSINISVIDNTFNITNATATADKFNITDMNDITNITNTTSSSSALIPAFLSPAQNSPICPNHFDSQTQPKVSDCLLALQKIPPPSSIQPVVFTRDDLPKTWKAGECKIEFGFEDPAILLRGHGNANATEVLVPRARVSRRQRPGQDVRDGEGPGEGGEADAREEEQEGKGDRIDWLDVQIAASRVVVGCGKMDTKDMSMDMDMDVRSKGVIGGLGEKGLLMVKVGKVGKGNG